MPKRFRPAVDSHLHRDATVTVERVQSFVSAPFDVQLEVRAELRRRLADDTSSMELGLFGLVIALVIGVGVSPHVKPVDGVQWWAPTLTMMVVAIVLAFAVLPAVFLVLPAHGRRVRAAVWLGAFDDAQHELGNGAAGPAPRMRWWARRHPPAGDGLRSSQLHETAHRTAPIRSAR